MNQKLVLCFSVYGTTRQVAKQIFLKSKADFYEIHPLIKYDSDRNHYKTLARIALNEQKENVLPKFEKFSINKYDTIYLAYPIWWDTLPQIIVSVLKEMDFSGKNVIPIITHMGAGESETCNLIQAIIPKANLKRSACFEMKDIEQGLMNLPDWLFRD